MKLNTIGFIIYYVLNTYLDHSMLLCVGTINNGVLLLAFSFLVMSASDHDWTLARQGAKVFLLISQLILICLTVFFWLKFIKF